MIEAVLALLVLAVAVFVGGVQLGMMLGTRLDRVVTRRLGPDDDGSDADDTAPKIAGPDGPPPEAELAGADGEGSRC